MILYIFGNISNIMREIEIFWRNVDFLRKERGIKKGDLSKHIEGGRNFQNLLKKAVDSNFEDVSNLQFSLAVKVARFFNKSLDDLVTIDLSKGELEKTIILHENELLKERFNKYEGGLLFTKKEKERLLDYFENIEKENFASYWIVDMDDEEKVEVAVRLRTNINFLSGQDHEIKEF